MHRGFPFCAGTMMSVSPLFSLSPGWKQLFSKINCFCTAVFPAIDQPAVPLCLKCRVACGGLYCQGFECFQAGHGYTTGLFMFGTEPVKLGGNLYAIISAWHSYLPVLLWLKGIYRWPDDLPGNTYLSPQRLLRVSGMCFLAAWGELDEELDVHQDQTWEWLKVCELYHIHLPYSSEHLWEQKRGGGVTRTVQLQESESHFHTGSSSWVLHIKSITVCPLFQ